LLLIVVFRSASEVGTAIYGPWLVYIRGMDYTDWLLLKAGVVLLAAFLWGVWCGITGRPLWLEQSGTADAATPTDAAPPQMR